MWKWKNKLIELENNNIDCALISIIDVGGSSPREIGAKMIVTKNEVFGTIGGGNLEFQIIDKAKNLLINGTSEKITIPLGAKAGQCCGGIVEVFIDILKSSSRLLIFGAGHVGQELTRVCEKSCFNITVIDERDEWLNKIQSPNVTKSKSTPTVLSSDYVVVLTHSHELDENLCFEISQKNPRFLGLIGSLTKKERFFKRLKERGLSNNQLEKIICPIGLPIGGKTPFEVAISISSQLIEFKNRDQ